MKYRATISAGPLKRRKSGNSLKSATGTPTENSGSREDTRSEEHTSELQSQSNLVCRLLLEKKKKKTKRLTLSDMPKQQEQENLSRKKQHDHQYTTLHRLKHGVSSAITITNV